MAQINVVDLTFYYDGSYDNIFEDVSFQIDTDWKLGFIARNGRGKTTFLNLLQGKFEYQGIISSPVEYDYFPYPVSDMQKDTLEVVEDVYPEYEFWKVCRELTLLGVESDVLYRPFQTLSNGEQTKVLLALLFSKENNFLLIDEPTNHLDMESRGIVKEYLNKKKGFILVSHDRTFLDGCVDHVLIINKANIEVQKGNFSSWWENKQRQDDFERDENEKLKKDINRLKIAAKKAEDWADQVESTKIGKKSTNTERGKDYRAYIGEKSRRMQQRRKNLESRQGKEIEEKSTLLKNIETVDDLKIFPLRHHKSVLLEMQDVKISYVKSREKNGEGENEENNEKAVLEKFNMKIENGDRILLQGKNGSGKTSIIKEILGENKENENQYRAAGLLISYVPQDASFLKGSLSEFAKEHDIDETLFKMLLRKLDFSRVQFEKNMEEYSGGQKKKVLIAGSLCSRAHLYIWDEPLNFIDIFSRMQIEDLILKFQPTILMVEHDMAFAGKVANKIIDISKMNSKI